MDMGKKIYGGGYPRSYILLAVGSMGGVCGCLILLVYLMLNSYVKIMTYSILFFGFLGVLILLFAFVFYLGLENAIMIYENAIWSPQFSKLDIEGGALYFSDIQKIEFEDTILTKRIAIWDKDGRRYVFSFIDFKKVIPILKNLVPEKFEEVNEK